MPETRQRHDREFRAGAVRIALGFVEASRLCGAAGVRLSSGFSVSCAAVEDAQPVVVGVGVAESLPFDGFDDPVRAFGGTVGEAAVEVGEQLGLPVPCLAAKPPPYAVAR